MSRSSNAAAKLVAGRGFSLAVQALIVLSLVAVSIETLPGLGSRVRSALHWFEAFTVAVFTIEYALRVFAAERKAAYVFSLLGIVDLVAIAPFYLRLAVDLRSVRILRLFRLFRMFKLVRYTRAMQRFRRAFTDIREELILYVIATGFLLYLSSVGIYYFERDAQPEAFASVFHSLWWSVATFTTVGYGDIYPVTVGGKVFTFATLVLGLGIIAIPSGLLAASLTKTDRDTDT